MCYYLSFHHVKTAYRPCYRHHSHDTQGPTSGYGKATNKRLRPTYNHLCWLKCCVLLPVISSFEHRISQDITKCIQTECAISAIVTTTKASTASTTKAPQPGHAWRTGMRAA